MNRIAAALIVMLGQAVAVSQSPPASEPTFSVSTHLVQIRATVRDKNGPVAGLTKDDFILTDRGTPREIRVFSADQVITRAVSGSPPPNTFSDAPQYGANVPASISIVLLDNLNTLYGSSPGPFSQLSHSFSMCSLRVTLPHCVCSCRIQALPRSAA